MTTAQANLPEFPEEFFNLIPKDLLCALAAAAIFIGTELAQLPTPCRRAMEIKLEAELRKPPENLDLLAQCILHITLNTSRDATFPQRLVDVLAQ